ncbi:MAG: MBL fold metallo-hydrolase [Colwellia sp.]|uniref:MBL fold metallo-hydrolase n=1 Tax=Colwellia sp. TaxID=56799 RepID=UPI0025B9E364|nr:MBL fold metallo-hydrolase [Colwellia sp.]NQZ26625.1 MBL fold metallo-hydrolase [Colwellia sp.]
MKNTLLFTLLLTVFTTVVEASEQKNTTNVASENLLSSLTQKQWIHGSQDCNTITDPAIEVFQYNDSSYILRQSKCLTFEAPFIYVLVGDEKILVIDTGATDDVEELSVYKTVLALQKKHNEKEQGVEREILVIHTHSHSDHYGGDAQFIDQEKVTLVPASADGINDFFAFEDWPNKPTTLELGGRSITIIPTPGHQEEAVSIYDEQTKWLLTGDTFYPGYVYIKDWHDYKASISRLTAFTNENTVSAILGSHIEMKSSAGEYYEIGTTYQPQEASLVLTTADLVALNTAMSELDEPDKVALEGLIVEPLGFLPKLIGSIVGLFF